jgi:hypothetical protein
MRFIVLSDSMGVRGARPAKTCSDVCRRENHMLSFDGTRYYVDCFNSIFTFNSIKAGSRCPSVGVPYYASPISTMHVEWGVT